MKRIIRNTISLVLCITMMFTMIIPAHAAEKREYVKEIKIETGTNAESVKKALTDAGYKVVESDLNGSSKIVAYLGYKTTNNASEAITDIKLMNMNGKYSYSDYEVLLEKQKAMIQESFNSVIPLIEEFRVNYAAGSITAVNAYELLNKIYDDDTKLNMGDFLLECGLEEGNRDELETVFLQGNAEIVLAIQQALAMGADTNETTFIDRLKDLDYDTMLDDYIAQYGSRKEAVQNMALDYDDDVDKALIAWDDFYAGIQKYLVTNNINVTELDEKAEKTAEDMPEVEVACNLVDSFVYETLKEIEYGEGTLFDFFNRPSSAVDVEEIYPFLASLSEGQRADLVAIGIYTLVENAVMDMIADENTAEAFSKCLNDYDTVSVYSGVDRQLFNGGIALTSEATSADARSASGGWQKPFEAAEDYYWLIGLATVVSLSTYIATTAVLNKMILNIAKGPKVFSSSLVSANFKLTEVGTKYNSYITRCFNLGTGYRSISTSLVNVHRVAFVFSMVMIFVNAALLTYEISKLIRDEEIEYINIPSRMVNYVPVGDKNLYVKYDCATNLKEKCADINAFKASEWLALYYTTDKNVGNPVLASSLEVMTQNTIPGNSKPVTLFNEGALFNLSQYTDNETYLVFEQEKASLTGSAFSNPTYFIFFGVAAVAAFGAAYFVTTTLKKNKKES